jgi:hypothetical protein
VRSGSAVDIYDGMLMWWMDQVAVGQAVRGCGGHDAFGISWQCHFSSGGHAQRICMGLGLGCVRVVLVKSGVIS